MQKLKRLLTDALAMACLVILTLLFVGLMVFLIMSFHAMLMDVMANNCYTNIFGEVICKIK